MIESLVRSNPSPAYISRVAGVFINNGAGVRGDMKAVLKAILLDPEARTLDSLTASDPNSGKLRDPILWWASVMRALGATSSATVPNVSLYEKIFGIWLSNLDELPRGEDSVFSYYSPDFKLNNGLYAPEFENENVNTLFWMTLHMQDAIQNSWSWNPTQQSQFNLDLGPNSLWYRSAANWGPTNFVNVLDALLLHGTMTVEQQQAIVNAIKYDDTATMVRCAVYLIVTSPQYRVMM